MGILDNDGNRIFSKYYDSVVFPTIKEQKAFEKNLFTKTHRFVSVMMTFHIISSSYDFFEYFRANVEIIMLDGLTCVYKTNVDLFFYVIGSSHENEVKLF